MWTCFRSKRDNPHYFPFWSCGKIILFRKLERNNIRMVQVSMDNLGVLHIAR